MQTAVIIVAAGRGTRMGGEVPKQWQMLAGKPVLAHVVAAFADQPVVLVIHPDDRARAAGLGVRLVEGGATRDASVLAGLRALEGSGIDKVLIHDGARPLVSRGLIDRLVAALDSHAGAAPALAVTDALWRGNGGAGYRHCGPVGALPGADAAGLSLRADPCRASGPSGRRAG